LELAARNLAADQESALEPDLSGTTLAHYRILDKILASGIDSLTAIEFMFRLEDAFGVSLSDERAELRTVADIAAIVGEALSARGTAA